MTDRRSGRDRDWTDAEAEGLPELDTPPPGIDSETAPEGLSPPRDHVLGADEPAVTALGSSRPETVEERTRRERPDRPQRPASGPAGRLVEDDVEDQSVEPQDVGEWADDGAGLSAEESAVHIEPE